jgi:hypothetical protein
MFSEHVAEAQKKISFLDALKLLEIGTGERSRGMKVQCPVCGSGGALRVWSDHGWCFSEQQYYTATGILAEKWQLDEESAAIRAMKELGIAMPRFEDAWEAALVPPPPARESLAEALRIWCGAQCADWRTRQYDEEVAGMLARCLGLLPKVTTPAECDMWLSKCKAAMGRVIARTGARA